MIVNLTLKSGNSIDVLIEDNVPIDKIITDIFNTDKIFDIFLTSAYKSSFATIMLSEIAAVQFQGKTGDTVLSLSEKIDNIKKCKCSGMGMNGVSA